MSQLVSGAHRQRCGACNTISRMLRAASQEQRQISPFIFALRRRFFASFAIITMDGVDDCQQFVAMDVSAAQKLMQQRLARFAEAAAANPKAESISVPKAIVVNHAVCTENANPKAESISVPKAIVVNHAVCTENLRSESSTPVKENIETQLGVAVDAHVQSDIVSKRPRNI
jgi:hypothetical protein